MSNQNLHQELWRTSYRLSKPFWDLYRQHIGNVVFAYDVEIDNPSIPGRKASCLDSAKVEQSNVEQVASDRAELTRVEEDVQNINADYLEFIRVTREHQAERDRLKQLELAKKPMIEEYYKDISQVNTLVEDNLVEAPTKNAYSLSESKKDRQKLIELYGSQENYEAILSMEMVINEHFSNKVKEISPRYWPAMPLNPKLYLNPLSLD